MLRSGIPDLVLCGEGLGNLDTDHVLVTDILSGDWDFALSYNPGIFCWSSLEMLDIISYTFFKKLRKILTMLRKPRWTKV